MLSRYPFTASQWQELEQQTLIFRYMANGIPIPSELILPLKRNFFLDSTISTTPSLAFPPHFPSLGWGWQYGTSSSSCRGGRGEDPEPGRCRRTDGKKWRCSKEAYPDSKYCERHMHRGKNRPRKPVEMMNNSSSSANNSAATSLSISSPAPTTLDYQSPNNNNKNINNNMVFSPYSSPSSSSRFNNNNIVISPYFHPDHNNQYYGKDYRYNHAAKDMDEYSFYSDASSGPEKESCLQLRPLGLGPIDTSTEIKQKQQQQHCFVLGADFTLEKPEMKKVQREEPQRPLRRFFDEWPTEKDREEEEEHESSYSKTQLSISIPRSHYSKEA